jgi:hypothetical protein
MPNVFFINKFQKLVRGNEKSAKEIDSFVFGKKIGLVTKLFGCRHSNLSRPFTHGKTSYRSCLDCGARIQFNIETLETHGNFYSTPIVKEERL